MCLLRYWWKQNPQQTLCFTGQQFSLKTQHEASYSFWYFVMDPEIRLQVITLHMSASHHSIYSKHIRHQLSGTSALWEPGAPPQIPTPVLWKPASPPASQTPFHWFVELFITCTELEPASHLNVLKKQKWYSHRFGVTTQAQFAPSAMCSHSVQLRSTSTQSHIDWTVSRKSCCCYCGDSSDATPE